MTEQKPKRPRGTGCLFKYKNSSIYWIKYSRNGVPIRESTETDNKKKAEQILRTRIGQVASGTYIGRKLEKVMVSELYDDLLTEYKTNGRKSIDDLEERWKLHLQPFFGYMRALQISSDLVRKYIAKRQEEEAANASINRELAALKRMFNLGRESTPPKVQTVPYIPMLRESNVRTGFLDTRQHDALANQCAKVGLWLRTAFEIGYTYGWRHDEVLKLRVEQIDLMNNTIRLDPGTTKNTDGREVKLSTSLRELLAASIYGKNPTDAVITRGKKPVSDFRKAWANVCKDAGVPGLLFHDLRRSAARNLRNAGVPENVIMEIGGWRTNSVFKRYAIVSQSDKADAMAKLEAQQKVEKEAAKQFGQSLVRVDQKTADSRIALPVPPERLS